MIKVFTDHLFAGIMDSFVMIEDVLYLPFSSLAECVICIILFTVFFLTLGFMLAEFLGFLLRCLLDYIQIRKGDNHG